MPLLYYKLIVSSTMIMMVFLLVQGQSVWHREATVQIVKEILDPANGVAGLVFLLPSGGDRMAASLEVIGMDLLVELERFLILNAVAIPVYFTKHNDETDAIMQSIQYAIAAGKPPSHVNGGYTLQIKSGNAKPIKHPGVHNYEGWLMGSDGKPGKPSSPTIAISAHYDAFSTAPGKPGGGNGSGVMALLSLVRYFSAIYKNPSTRPSLNILFLLTGGGGVDFNGLKYWLKTTDTRVLDSLQFVVSLDELSGLRTENELFLHYSKPPKDDNIAEWYRNFEKAAETENIRLSLLHKKINLALPHMSWEHEHVAQHKMLGATLSGLREASNPMFRSSVLDNPQHVDREMLTKAIKVVGNAVSMKLYEEEGRMFHAFANASQALPGMGPRFVERWLTSLDQLPRMAPFVAPEDPFGAAVLRFLKDHTDKGSVSSVKMDPTFVFYDSIAFEMGAYKTAGFLFDLLLFVAVVVYLSLLFISLKIITQGWNAFLSLFKPSKHKWKKGSSSGKGMAQRLLGSVKKQ